MMFFGIAFDLYFLRLPSTSEFLTESLCHLQWNTHFSILSSKYTLPPAHWPKAIFRNRCALALLLPGSGCGGRNTGLPSNCSKIPKIVIVNIFFFLFSFLCIQARPVAKMPWASHYFLCSHFAILQALWLKIVQCVF